MTHWTAASQLPHHYLHTERSVASISERDSWGKKWDKLH